MYLSFFLSFFCPCFLSIHLPISLSVYLSVCVYHVNLLISLSIIRLPIQVCLSSSIFVYKQSIYPDFSECLSLCLPVSVSFGKQAARYLRTNSAVFLLPPQISFEQTKLTENCTTPSKLFFCFLLFFGPTDD